jgi:hypothetical protein
MILISLRRRRFRMEVTTVRAMGRVVRSRLMCIRRAVQVAAVGVAIRAAAIRVAVIPVAVTMTMTARGRVANSARTARIRWTVSARRSTARVRTVRNL